MTMPKAGLVQSPGKALDKQENTGDTLPPGLSHPN